MSTPLLSELKFLFKICALFFLLGLGFVSPKYSDSDKKRDNLTLIEKANLAGNFRQDSVFKSNKAKIAEFPSPDKH